MTVHTTGCYPFALQECISQSRISVRAPGQARPIEGERGGFQIVSCLVKNLSQKEKKKCKSDRQARHLTAEGITPCLLEKTTGHFRRNDAGAFMDLLYWLYIYTANLHTPGLQTRVVCK